jgi:hypothetical protein
MNKQELTTRLHQNHKIFLDYMHALSGEDFLHRCDEKWTAGQQLEHICLSVKPLVQVLGFPKFVIKILFGSSNRPSRTYDELVEKYSGKLQVGGKAGGRFVPNNIALSERAKLSESLSVMVQKLNVRIGRFSEKELDMMILPHPLLGKVTLREMIYFTMYHVQHHQKIAQRNLNA